VATFWCNRKTPAAEERSSTATFEQLWWAFQDAFARKLKKLVLATGVLICFSQDLQKKGSPHLQPILNPLVASRRLISTNMSKNPFAFFHAATKVEVGTSFENVGLGLEALRHPEHPDDPACRQQRLRGLRPRQLQ